ncbi:ABC transporter (iron.B12.siderophore.hemin), periplasmic substrate-binding component [Actinokineospora spheciospongiae]|uniref:ABC transporter (Iron.B12.siderophore.hemin), periplasmic substrate-binding component n=1 Tax=Actinokineospora spheciospongiae TaxID=909613 RepID=W7IVU8_9PSEU|nr:ABC transporter substrate-binding protein [Actinokineospora spheciospongiae]EWC60912.1 ABC transporter (iron.B12.siderophore.hemin), periplasmic substrate-binding component [Actinokineospora spheciospongiae]
MVESSMVGNRKAVPEKRHRFRCAVATLFAASLLAAGCAGGEAEQAAGGAQDPSGHYPVTVDNCGRKVTFDKAPSRVYLGFQSAAELFFGLGLGDRAIAQIKPMDTPLPEQAADFERVADKSPDAYVPVGKEEMFGLRPDMLFAYVNSEYGGPDQLAPGLATVDELGSIGAQVYALVCPDDNPVQTSFTYRAIADLGVIFDVEDRATALIEEMKARVADVQKRVAGREPVPVFYYYGGEGPITTGSRDAFVNEVIGLAGGKNVFGDVGGGRRGFLRVSQEQVAATDPAVFLIGASANSDKDAQAKTDYLHRLFPEMRASKDKRHTLTYDTANTPGWRWVDVVEDLARTLHPDAFADKPATPPTTTRGSR